MPASAYLELMPEDFSEESRWKSDVSTFDSGREQRRGRWASDRKIYHYNYPNAIDSQITDLFDYWTARKGNWESFYLAVPPYLTHSETVSGAGSIVLTDGIKPSPNNMTVRLDGNLVSGWSYDESSKTITFVSPLTGSLVVTFVELKLVRFLSEVYSRDWMVFLVTSQTLDFIEIK